MTNGPTPSPTWRSCLVLLLLCFTACGSFEDKRIRELLIEKGFGSRAQGDATRENYVGGLDMIQFLLSPTALAQAGAERLGELLAPQPVGVDGTIFVPYVGPLYVLGKTEVELSTLVRAQLRSVLNFDVEVQARIVGPTKYFYAIGEVSFKGRIRIEPDMTLMDAMFVVNWSGLANLGRVYLIRPDAEHPLVIDINFREMLTTGGMRPNIAIRERDILYVPPTFLGLIARLLQRVLEPVAVAVRTMLGVAQIRAAYDVVSGQDDALYFRF